VGNLFNCDREKPKGLLMGAAELRADASFTLEQFLVHLLERRCLLWESIAKPVFVYVNPLFMEDRV